MIRFFRDPDWLDADWLKLWGTGFALSFLALLFLDFHTHMTLGITDAQGEHIGRDFINYWSGAQLAGAGHAATVYDVDAYNKFQQGVAGPLSTFRMYSYPPVLMLLTLPLAATSFMIGFALWSIASFAIVAKLLAKYMSPHVALVAMMAAPACFLNILSGQNGGFTAALLAGGPMLLDRRQVLAGVLIGLLCYKPQLGVLLPVALAAGGYWRAFFSAGATVAVLAAATTLAFGWEIWPGFFGQMHRQSDLMENGDIFWHRMPSVFCLLRNFGAPVTSAYAAQAVAALAAIVIVWRIWRGRASLALKSAVLALALFLATPYAWDYDMVILVFALAWVAADARVTGWQPWEKLAWALLLLLPYHMTIMASLWHLQLGTLFMLPVFWFTCRRAIADRGTGK